MGAPTVSAVILAHDRRESVRTVLDRLRTLPLDEVIVVDSGSTDGTDEMVRARIAAGDERLRLVAPGANVALAGRNLGAAAASGRYVVMLDDDSFPRPGAIESCVGLLERCPGVAVVGGLVRDVTPSGELLKAREPGTFDWWLRCGRRPQEPPPDGWPTFFFPEGGCVIRRDAYLEVGGFLEPFFFTVSEVDLTTRLLGAGWDVRYLPTAVFDHLKEPSGRLGNATVFHHRVRNQLWYFWLHFPPALALRRMVAYLLFDLVECAYRGVARSWWSGLVAAWRRRDTVRPYRQPLPRSTLRRAELNRGRLHLRLLGYQLWRRIGPAR